MVEDEGQEGNTCTKDIETAPKQLATAAVSSNTLKAAATARKALFENIEESSNDENQVRLAHDGQEEYTFAKDDETASKQSTRLAVSSHTLKAAPVAQKLEVIWPPPTQNKHQNTTHTAIIIQTNSRNSTRALHSKSPKTTTVDSDGETWKDRRQKRLQKKIH